MADDVESLQSAFALIDADGNPIPLTASLDYVIRVDNDAQRRLKADHDLELPGAGIYVLDHKSSTSKKNVEEWDMSMQFVGYQLMYAAIFDEEPRGMIAANIVRHKKLTDKSFNLHVVPWEDAVRNHAAFANMIQLSTGLIEASFPNATSCFSYYRKCYHYMQGRCNRS